MAPRRAGPRPRHGGGTARRHLPQAHPDPGRRSPRGQGLREATLRLSLRPGPPGGPRLRRARQVRAGGRPPARAGARTPAQERLQPAAPHPRGHRLAEHRPAGPGDEGLRSQPPPGDQGRRDRTSTRCWPRPSGSCPTWRRRATPPAFHRAPTWFGPTACCGGSPARWPAAGSSGHPVRSAPTRRRRPSLRRLCRDVRAHAAPAGGRRPGARRGVGPAAPRRGLTSRETRPLG